MKTFSTTLYMTNGVSLNFKIKADSQEGVLGFIMAGTPFVDTKELTDLCMGTGQHMTCKNRNDKGCTYINTMEIAFLQIQEGR